MRVTVLVGAALVAVGFGGGPATARGQGYGGAASGQPVAGPLGSGVSPLGNPLLNPWWGPDPVAAGDPRALALYFLAEQRARGGIGSGRLSVLGPQGAAGYGRFAGRPPAEMPRSSSVPGGGARGYFGRGPAPTAGASRYYQQHGRYFSNNAGRR